MFKILKFIVTFMLIIIIGLFSFVMCIFSGDDLSDDWDSGDVATMWVADEPTDEVFTLMVYMVGSDLESVAGCGSADIEEMLKADLGEQVNVVIQTGGAAYWHNPVISGDTCQRFSIQDNQLVEEADLGLVSMVEPGTVADFIQWTASAYPADSYGFVFWNHGGGTIMGFGADEHFEGQLLLSDMAQAMGQGGVHMDFIGFDACLMGTIETAWAMAPYADYLIASEETEPGSGWYYSDWLTALAGNPAVDTVTLGTKIVDDYVSGPDSFFWDNMTLSVVDLAEIPSLYETLCGYMAQSSAELADYGFGQIAQARSDAKDYGEGQFEQIDIANYIDLAEVDGGDEVLRELEEAVVYFDHTVWDSAGLAMYYPYDYPEYYSMMLQQLQSMGMHQDHLNFFSEFVSVMTYGHTGVRSTGSIPFIEQTQPWEQVDYSSEFWYQPALEQEYQGDELELGEEELIFDEKEDYFALRLSEEEWEQITVIEQQIFMDDGEGYIDLGLDNVYEFDDDGDLIADFDYTWVALDGQIVPFYAVEDGDRPDGSWYSYGYVPAELNSQQDIEIIVYWDEEHPDGYVVGYRPMEDQDELSLSARNLLQLEEGDTLDFFCDFYTYDEEYDSTYYFGETLECGSEIMVSYEDIGEYTTLLCFRLEDVYQNEYWTEWIEFYFE